MADNNLYTKDSIESLSPLEFTRLRPGVYAGDCTYSTQLLVEIVSNSVDEFRLGHGDTIDVELNKSVVTVSDNGQGFLVNEIRDDGKSVLEAAFSVLNTSGKYREDGTYEGTSLGSFGIGSKITTFLSHWLKVITYNNGQFEDIDFSEGVFNTRAVGPAPKGKTGTKVCWLPSEDFFTNTEVEVSKIKDLFRTLTCLCPGLTINLNDNGKRYTYNSVNGISDLVDELTNGKELIKNRCEIHSEDNKNKIDFILTYTSNYASHLVPYVNTGLTEKGPHITQIKTLITREFNKFFKSKKWIKNDSLSGDDIQEGMYIVFNLTTPGVSYDAQVKSTITKIDMTSFVNILSQEIQNWLSNNEHEVKIIADKAIAAKKAREAAKKARDAARNQVQKKEKVVKFDSKLADCFSKDRTKCEIYVTEGDSASGNLKAARDNEFQAVMPVRGKILNTQKATLDKIKKNAEIMTMIEAFGLKVDSKTMKLTYNPSDLRYDKIIIASDADVDGSHIKNLFYTFIWNFCPQLIEDGHVYALIPPLYRIIEGNNKYVYLKDDAEMAEYAKNHQNTNYEVSRLKGLGEMSEEETEETLTNIQNRTIQQITVDDAAIANQLFDELMGNAVGPRKDFIKQNSWRATYGV